MNKYRLLAKKGEGTFSEVFKAQDRSSGKLVAIKCIKSHFSSIEQVSSLREIQALRLLSPHAHIIQLIEVVYDEPTGRLALVFELMDLNLYEKISQLKCALPDKRIKSFTYQLLKSLDHMHTNGIFHRDIKPENILITGDTLKLADLGSCRGINTKMPYTEYISTRWYRPPECLLTDGYYNHKMDIWGVGCVLFEIQALFPLFPGKNELDQIKRIHSILGTPSMDKFTEFQKHASHMEIKFAAREGTGIDNLIPQVSEQCKDLIKKLLIYDAEQRITAKEAMNHVYFKGLNIHTRSSQSVHSVEDTFEKLHKEIALKNQKTVKNEKKKGKRFLPAVKKIYKNPSMPAINLVDRSPNASKLYLPSMKSYLSPYGGSLKIG